MVSWRTLSAKQALQKMLPHQSFLSISRLADLSQFVTLPIHVVQAVRTNLIYGQVSATTGKGWSLTEALCGAYGEALERYCAAYPLPHKYVSPETQSLACAPLTGFGHDRNYNPKNWLVVEDLLCGQPYLLPALEVYFPYHGEDLAQTRVRPHTSGLASGSTIAEAALFGLFEVIERHTSSRFFHQYRQRSTGAFVTPSSITLPKIQYALRSLQKRGYEFFIFRLDSLLPTYYMAIFDVTNLGPKFMVAGLGCSASEANALNSAVLEAMQAIVIAAQGAREDLTRMADLYSTQQVGKNSPFYRIREILGDLNPEYDFCGAKENSSISTEQVLQKVLSQLKQQGVPAVYQCDLSQPQLPLAVVKIIVPTMFDFHINPSRECDVITYA